MSLGMDALRPGDIMFGPIGNTLPGFLPGRLQFMPGTFPVSLGQWLFARTRKGEWNVDHVAVVVEASHTTGRGDHTFDPRIVQAMPSGAEEISIGLEHWTGEYMFIRPEYSARPSGAWANQADRVAAAARFYVGTPYSFLDYVAIAGLHAGVRNGPIRGYVTSSRHMICSQLADQAMSDAGWHVFDDGRLPQDVMPVELQRKMLGMAGWYYIPGNVGWRRCGEGTATA
jgi:hypothetical protein